MTKEDITLGIVGYAGTVAIQNNAIPASMVKGVSTAIGSTTPSNIGAMIAKVVSVIPPVDPVTAGLSVATAAAVGGIGYLATHCEPIEFDDFDDMCAYAQAHQL